MTSMFESIDGERLLAMVPQEVRWMNNLKKAFLESDLAVLERRAADDAFPAACKAIDVAATLRLSLQTPVAEWKAPSTKDNKAKFVSFLHLEVPTGGRGGLRIPLVDARTGKTVVYEFGTVVYAIRCMIHENENLNAAENPDFHVTLDWSMPERGYAGSVCDGRLTCNARFLWGRVREILAKFILCTEAYMAFARGDSFCSFGIDPPFGSVHPEDGRHRTACASS